ncbi:hypothetical protein WCE41_13230 [Luteimonas sp. MJ246]|uniref:hypothetical protein n=1 Tax=Luteimonas sp. MJ174 TaxID=3129237 RepID=UPI0031BB986B
MRIRFLLPLLLLPVLASPALAQMPSEPAPTDAELQRAQQRAEAWQAYGLRVAKAVGRSDGARDLALATLLEAMAQPYDEGSPAAASVDAQRWRSGAEAKGAGDTITQQLLLAAGAVAGEQDASSAAARRWQALSPGNLAPLLHQGLAPEAVLSAAAQATRNAPDPYPMLRWVAATLARHPPSRAEWAAFGEGTQPSPAAHAAVWASSLHSLLLPDYREVLGACTGRQLRAAGRADACRHMAGLLLARPQTVLDERIGLSMARALTRSVAERAPLDARRRGVDWRQEQLAELAGRDEAGSGDPDLLARLLADPSIDTEDALVRRTLAEARLAQEPPAGWRAPWQQPRR